MLTKERMSRIKKLVFAWDRRDRTEDDDFFDSIYHMLFELTEPFSTSPVEGRSLSEECMERLDRASREMEVSLEELTEWYVQLAVSRGEYPRAGESLEQLEARRGEL